MSITDDAFDRVAEHLATALSEVGVTDGDITTIVATVAALRPAIVTGAAASVDPTAADAVGMPGR